MREAIGWLMQKDFISERDKEYNLTESGRDLLIEIHLQAPKPFDAWDLLKKKFDFSWRPIKVANISQTEWQKAVEAYYNRAKSMR